MSSNAAVEARDLRKSFGSFEAVAGIDFRIEAGECFGFLGPNGAGKTSTMRMVQAVSPPSGGSLRVLGLDPVTDGRRLRSRLGVCPQEDNLDPELTVRQNLVVYAGYYGIDRRQASRRADELLDFVQLTEKRDRRIVELSGGMKRRLVVARALVNDPDLFILDEPTTGLDPQARHLIWSKLRELGERGTTMILTTHYMDEAERLCDRLVIMDRGSILAEGAPRDLVREHVGEEVVELTLPAERESDLLDGLPIEGIATERSGDVRGFFFERRTSLADQLVERAREARVTCSVRNASLEDVFLKLTGRELDE